MIETDLPELNNEPSPWVQKVLNELDLSYPKFKTKIDAINTLAAELEDLAAHRSLTVQALLDLASSSIENHEDLDQSLRLTSLLYALRNS